MAAKRLALIVVGGLLSGTTALGTAAADSGFRCGSGRLVDRGDRNYEVRKKCGEPESISETREKRKVKEKVRRWIGGVMEEVTEEREIEVPVEEWVYDLGPQRLVRFVYFEDGRVVNITTGEYGSKT